jgi:hypothetical protein
MSKSTEDKNTTIAPNIKRNRQSNLQNSKPLNRLRRSSSYRTQLLAPGDALSKETKQNPQEQNSINTKTIRK